MTSRTSLLATFVCLASLARAQSHLEWLATHDGPASQADYGRALAVDASGAVYVAGRSYNPSTGIPPPPPTADFELVKFSSTGTQLWSARQDVFGDDDIALDCGVAPNGDVYQCGYSWNGNDIDLTLVKYSSAGTFQWLRTYGTPSGVDWARALAFDAAGNVIVVGQSFVPATNSDILLLAYSPAGTLLWSTTKDGGANAPDDAFALAIAPTGEIVVAGQVVLTLSGYDFAVAKFTSGGTFQWLAKTDGGLHLTDGASALSIDGSLVHAAGWSTKPGVEDWMVQELDLATGAVHWTKTSNGPGALAGRARAIARDSHGVLWVAGSSASNGTGFDFVVRRYDAAGTQLGEDRWNDPSTNLDEQPTSLMLGNAGQVFVAGSATRSSSPLNVDAAIAQYDESGARDWVGTYSSTGSFDDRVFEAALVPGNRIALGGYTNSGPSGGYDYLALQVDLNDAPQGYCTAKTNTLGCTPTVHFTGLSSAVATSGFTLICENERNQKNGFFFYGINGPANAPFQGGYMCVQPPTVRTPLTNTGGNTAPPDDCSGAFSLDMNAYAAGVLGGVHLPQLSTPGTLVCCEAWSRDPGALLNTNLSSAIRYVVLP